MLDRTRRTAKSIRMKDDAYYLAKMAAVASRKTLGQWLEDAINEKLTKEPFPGLPKGFVDFTTNSIT